MGTETYTYKLRAECASDVEAMKEALFDRKIVLEWSDMVHTGAFADVEFTFGSRASLEELRDAAEDVDDGHVMVETLAPLADYTGERTYGCDDE